MSVYREPVVGGDTDNWGAILNETLDNLNDRIDEHTGTIAARLPLAGGTMTGRLRTKTESMVRVDLGTVSGDVTLDLDAGNYFMIEPTGATNIIISNVPTGTVATAWLLKMLNPGVHNITWENGDIRFKWQGGIVPSFTVSGVDTLLFITDNNGDSIRVSRLLRDSRQAGT